MAAPRTGRPLTDLAVVGAAAAVVAAVWLGSVRHRRGPWFVVALAASVAALTSITGRRAAVATLAAVLVVLGAVRSSTEWAAVRHVPNGTFTGWSTVVGDPAPVAGGTEVVLQIEGRRFVVLAFGSSGRKLSAAQAGERWFVTGRRGPLGARARRWQERHVVGRFTPTLVGDRIAGSPLSLGAARVRGWLRRGAERGLDPDDAALFAGLVIGDDAREPPTMIADFRAAGLSHLTAVSGENVAFVLAAAGVVLRRLPRWPRTLATLALIGGFVVLTRAEPSVLRAGVMAALGALAAAVGVQRPAVRALAASVVLLVLADPFLVWSVGFWLSVSATAGVTVVAPRLAAAFGGPAWLRTPLSLVVGAQAGAAVPSLLVFGRVSAVAVPANLLAVPVADVVMLLGCPTAVLAGALPRAAATVVMLPLRLATRWVAVVAGISARLAPSGAVALAWWVVQAMVVAGLVVAGRAARGRRAPTMADP